MNQYPEIEKVLTDASLIDEIVYECRQILKSIVVKDEEKATKNETLKSLRESDLYHEIQCNSKYKQRFGTKAKMLSHDEVEPRVGHGVGGVCPFGVNKGVEVYLDESLRRFDTVYPAAGNAASAVRLTPDELAALLPGAQWVDVCKEPEHE